MVHLLDTLCPNRSWGHGASQDNQNKDKKKFVDKVSCMDKLAVCFFTINYKLSNVVYCSFYFYFLPFTVVFLSWNPNGITSLIGSITKDKAFWDMYEQMTMKTNNTANAT